MLSSTILIVLTVISNISITNGQQIDDYPCFFPILSVNHAQGPLGMYFNFDVNTVNCILAPGSQLQAAPNANILTVFYSGDNSIRIVRMWNTANGGTTGSGHGRNEPNGNVVAQAGDWAVGEFIAFHGMGNQVACACNNTPTINDFGCSFPILSNDHGDASTQPGMFFNFNVSTVDCTLGVNLAATSRYNIFYSGDNSFRYVIMWNRANGGTIGDGHGRKEPGPRLATDWAVGQRIAFLGTPACGCPTQLPTNQPTTAPSGNPSFSPSPAPTNEPSPAPTEEPTDAPTECACKYSVEEYLDICYCGNQEEQVIAADFGRFNSWNNDANENDNDGYVKLSLPVSVFYVLFLLLIGGVVLVFGGCFVVMRKLLSIFGDNNSVKFTKQVNFTDPEDMDEQAYLN